LLTSRRSANRDRIGCSPSAKRPGAPDNLAVPKNNRAQFIEALRACRVHRAVLAIARLDRLSRNAAIHILAAVAEYESRLISERTKEAKAAAKARGMRRSTIGINIRGLCLGAAASLAARRARMEARANDFAPIIWPLVAEGFSPARIAAELNRQGIPSPKARHWHASSVVPMLESTRGEGSVKLTGALCRLEQGRRRFEHPGDPRSMGLFRRFVGEALSEFAVENGRPNLKQKMAPRFDHCICCFLTIRRATRELTADSARAEAMRRPDRNLAP